MNNRVHTFVFNVTGYTPTTIQMQLKLDYAMKIVLLLPKSYNLIKLSLWKDIEQKEENWNCYLMIQYLVAVY